MTETQPRAEAPREVTLAQYLHTVIERCENPRGPAVQMNIVGTGLVAGYLSASHGVFHLETQMQATSDTPGPRRGVSVPARISFAPSTIVSVIEEIAAPKAPVIHVPSR